MPDEEIWRISSPLKLAEYAAAGLLTIGPDHIGNRFDTNERWSILADKKTGKLMYFENN